MAKPFSAVEAATLKRKHQEIRIKVQNASTLVSNCKRNIVAAVEDYATNELGGVLKNIPIEEINRDKQGIRTKALRDAGYETIADLSTATLAQVIAVKGISQENALAIRKTLNDIAFEAKKSVKIRLNPDHKTPITTLIVKQLDMLRKAGFASQTNVGLDGKCRSISGFAKPIDYALEQLEPAISPIKWAFTSKPAKDMAMTAYEQLSSLLDGEYGHISEDIINEAATILATTDDEAWNDYKNAPIDFSTIIEAIVPGMIGGSDELYGLPEELARSISELTYDSTGLSCTLRRYQEWGVKYILHQKRALLGDEMGLGKTVQAIAVLVALRNEGASHFVVVCPASVLSNWSREIKKHSDLKVITIHGNSKDKELIKWQKEGGVAVTTFETTAHFDLPDDFKVDMCVVDEAHYIKNPEAQRTVNVKTLCAKSEKLLFMTGTALENRVGEMVELIKVLSPDVANQVKTKAFLATAPQFRELVAPVYYRRKRSDVLTELPDLIECMEWCILSRKEEAEYVNSLAGDNYAYIRRVSWNVNDAEESSKAKRLKELVEAAKEDDRKVIVFSFFLDTINMVCNMMGDNYIGPITGSIPPEKRQELIDEFDKAPAGTVLAAQIQSGGTGLNIQSASVVILCEPQLKPSIENQAISRAYRMGQARNVFVHRLVCDDTIDEKMIEMLIEKQTIFDAFADKSVVAEETMEIDEKSLAVIVEEERIRTGVRDRETTPVPT